MALVTRIVYSTAQNVQHTAINLFALRAAHLIIQPLWIFILKAASRTHTDLDQIFGNAFTNTRDRLQIFVSAHATHPDT